MKRKVLWKASLRKGLATVLTLAMCCSLLQAFPAKAQANGMEKIPGGTVTQVEKPITSLKQLQTGETKAVKPDTNYLDKKEPVHVIVVLEDKPLLEKGYTATNFMKKAAGKAAKETLIEKQDALFAKIQNAVVPSGARKGSKNAQAETIKLNYHFTLSLNGMSITVPYGELNTVKEMDGVKAAFVAPRYSVEPMTQESGKMVGRTEMWANGYTGKGMKIAILDTGLNVSHPVFSPLSVDKLTDSSLTEEKITKILTGSYSNLHANDMMKSEISADKIYHNTKVPYAFDYAGKDFDVEHGEISDHGTHVAGIAAGNETKTPDGTVVGVAKDAQILVMKVFGGQYAEFDTILAALDDAMTLGADSINMSLGSTAGFSKELAPDSEALRWTNKAYGNIFNTDAVLAISAGNEGSSAQKNPWYTNQNPVDCPDNSTVGSPSTYETPTSIASIDNEASLAFFVTAGNRRLEYNDTAEKVKFTQLAGKKMKFAMVGNLGCSDSDFTKANVKGKIAVVQRGECTFVEKQERARLAGAIGCIVYNNVDEPLNRMIIEETIPCVCISMADGKYLESLQKKGKAVLTAAKGGAFFARPKNVMSSFTSWGVTPDLQLKPEITAPGGNIYSSTNNGTYGLMSGTSMAAPHIAGVAAIIKQALLEKGIKLPAGELRKRIDALMMSTATPVTFDEKEGTPYSPRLQGSGLANAFSSVTSNAYLSVKDSAKPKISMGDDVRKTGVYNFSFDINNTSDHELAFEPKANVMTEDYYDYQTEGYPYFMAEIPMALKDAKVEFKSASLKEGIVTVPKKDKTTVEVTITLSDENKAYMDKIFKNGIFVEGFVRLKAITANEINLTLPYMGFYGDWTAASIFDGPFDGYNYNMKESSLFSNFEGEDSGATVGMNYNSDEPALPQHFVISPNGDGTLDYVNDMEISLMRNARAIDISFVNHENGMVYYKRCADYPRKSYYEPDDDKIQPFTYSWYVWNMELDQPDFFDFMYHGTPLANGTKVDLVLRATPDYNKHTSGNKNEVIVPLTVDVAAPVLSKDSMKLTKDEKTGKSMLDITVSDDTYLASLIFGNKDFTNIFSSNEFTDEEHKVDPATGKKTVTKTYDVTGFGNEFSMMVSDYGYNCSYFDFNITEWDNSKEAVSKDLVLAPYLSDNSATGWEKIVASLNKQIKDAAGAEISLDIHMRSAKVVPKSVLSAIAGKNIVLGIVLDNGATWKLYGTDIKKAAETNFNVDLGLAAVPETVLAPVVGERKITQFTVNEESCTYSNELYVDISELTKVEDTEKKDIEEKVVANLYYYNLSSNALELVSVSGDNNGYAGFNVEKAGNYVLVMDKKADITKNMVFETKAKAQNKTLYVKGSKGKVKTTQINILNNSIVQEVIDQQLTEVKATYASSNSKVATVNETGLVTAKKAGKTTITLTYKVGTVTIKRHIRIIVK
ncbi:MAG: S8 family serine peptidase [Lachnospiraceae bacterium]